MVVHLIWLLHPFSKTTDDDRKRRRSRNSAVDLKEEKTLDGSLDGNSSSDASKQVITIN